MMSQNSILPSYIDTMENGIRGADNEITIVIICNIEQHSMA